MRRRTGFTLAEMLVVIGIIVLFVTMAVPAVRALNGSSSTSVARNEVASLLTRAREEAVGIQDIRGVLFFVDPGTDRMTGVICQAATIQDPRLVNTNTGQPILLLDAIQGRDSLVLPSGVRLQMLYNGLNPTAQTFSGNGGGDRYLGFNPLSSSAPPTIARVGGCILFDTDGRTVVRPYGFQMNEPNAAVANATLLSTLGSMLGYTTSTTPTGTISGSNGVYASAAFVPGASSSSAPLSQLGLVLFDYETFKGQGFSDLDADINGQAYTSSNISAAGISQTQSEQAEETWLDQNSSPVFVNRYNGTLIRSE